MVSSRSFAGSAALVVAVAAWPGAAGAAERPASAASPVVIRAVEGLRFDPPRLQVAAGSELHLRFENADTTAQPHNLVVVRPGTREAVVAAAAAMGSDGPSRGYVPALPAVLAASRLVAAGESEELVVTIPKEAGIYPITCTFPGHGVVMFGALYAGVEMPGRQEEDRFVPKPSPPVPIEPDPRPMVRRIFLPHASPASIAVALPGEWNFCWDAGPCRLRYLWRGGFLSADKHFEGKGQAVAVPAGPVVLTASEPFPVRLDGRESKVVAFRGYSLVKGLPTFEYTVDGQLIRDGFSENCGSLVRRFEAPGAVEPVKLHVALEPGVIPVASRGVIAGEWLRLSAAEAIDVTLTYALPSAGNDHPLESR